jgi:hypothetical protein
VSIDPANPFPGPSPLRHERDDLGVVHNRKFRQAPEKRRFAVRQASKDQLTKDERVQQHRVIIQELAQPAGRRDARYFLQTEVSTMTEILGLASRCLLKLRNLSKTAP